MALQTIRGVIEQYAKYDNRIQVIHKKNEGISKARNLGLDICTGDYISFIDSDDFIRKDTYEILLNYIQRKDIDIVWYDYLEYACQGSNLLEQRQNMFIEEKYYDLDNSRDRKDFAKDLFNKYHLIGYVWNKLYKRQIWKNIRFPYKMSCEDGYVLMSSLTKAKNILVIPNSLYYYRVDNYNSSTKKRPQNFKYSFVESRLIRAIEYSCLYPNSVESNTLLYRAYRESFKYIINTQKRKYKYCGDFILKKSIKLLNERLPYKKKISMFLSIIAYKILSIYFLRK